MGQSLLLAAKDFLTNNLATIVAGGFGAYFGAWSAQAIIARKQDRQSVVAELNSINAVLAADFMITNVFIGFKKQHVLGLRTRYEEGRQAYQTALTAHAESHTVQVELRAISAPRVPKEILERLAFEKISLMGRGLAAAVALVEAIDSLSKSITSRNELINELKTAPLPGPQQVAKYFGLPSPQNGVVDERHRNSIESVSACTDDCIFFSHLLVQDLAKYGKRLRRRARWKYISRLPRLSMAGTTLPQDSAMAVEGQRRLTRPVQRVRATRQRHERLMQPRLHARRWRLFRRQAFGLAAQAASTWTGTHTQHSLQTPDQIVTLSHRLNYRQPAK